MPESTSRIQRFPPWLQAIRPHQWTKNGLLLAAFLFAYWDRDQDLPLNPNLIVVLLAAGLFCLVSSAVYIINDLHDREQDRHHPRKQHRPFASGALSAFTGMLMALGLMVIGLTGSILLNPQFAVVIVGYVLLQVVYTFLLKSIALLDVFIIAVGFVLRAIAGAVVIDAEISPWLLLCTFLLALFLALCKRRHEKTITAKLEGDHRTSLENYETGLLNQLISIVSSATVVSYALYTLSPDTVEKFGTAKLGFTIPFVLFGIFRYLDLVYRHDQGERPEKILLTDIPLIISVILYGITTVIIFTLS